MLNKNFKNKLKEYSLPLSIFIGIILLWELLVWALNIPEFILPRPSQIIATLISQFGFLIKHLTITMSTAIIGYLIANLLSFIIAVLFVHSKILERGFYPFIIIIKTIPILALAPILILWLGIGIASKLAIVVVACFFPLVVNTLKGLQTVDPDALIMFKSLSASKWHVFLKLRLPSSLPYLFSALKISTALALIGAFVGEFIASNEGIGFVILEASRTFDNNITFAALTLSSAAGILFFGLISYLEKKIVFWQKVD